VQDRRGFMWFGTNEGLNRLNPKTRSFEHYRHDPADPFSLWRNNVQFLFIDRDGDLWVCYERNGFSLLT
jgi:ligand-binding sensor domain-containing protein